MASSRKSTFKKYPAKHIPRARALRKNMTPQERKLWYQYLRTYPIKFYRQRPVGPYIADFYCSQAKLVIELDGSQHYTVEGEAYDTLRSQRLQQLQLQILRISNRDIDETFAAVCDGIDQAVKRGLGQGRGEEQGG